MSRSLNAVGLVGSVALTVVAIVAPNDTLGSATGVLFLAVPAALAFVGQRHLLLTRSLIIQAAAAVGLLCVLVLVVGAVVIASPLPLSRTAVDVALGAPTVLYFLSRSALELRRRHQGRAETHPAASPRPIVPGRRATRMLAPWLAMIALMGAALGLSVWSQASSRPGYVELSASRVTGHAAARTVQYRISIHQHGGDATRYRVILSRDGVAWRDLSISPGQRDWSRVFRLGAGERLECRLVDARRPDKTVRAIELG